MGNCHPSGSSPRSGAGSGAPLCSNAGSWTRSRTPGNFSLGAPSTKAPLKGASARFSRESYAIRRRGVQADTRPRTSASRSVSAAEEASPAFRGIHSKPQRANCDIYMSASSRDPLCCCLQLNTGGGFREVSLWLSSSPHIRSHLSLFRSLNKRGLFWFPCISSTNGHP